MISIVSSYKKEMIIMLEELRRKRLDYVTTIRENNFEKGINNLLTELYPDNAHFIYELLQNAEDTNATWVEFQLYPDKLVYTHNGLRTFDLSDVESITSIGSSTKANDVNQIGKFGVGFKAVFAYTVKPQIYSGEYSFEISDLVVPYSITDIERDKENTIMVFPFNNPSKSHHKAFDEISQRLESLEDTTLLFLQNIKEIKYVIHAEEKVSNTIECKKIDSRRIKIINHNKHEDTEWLVFKKIIPNEKNLFVSIAYSFIKNESNRLKIVPVEGKVSIFFPAEKETSKLKFHLHAPFASTVARDSIKDSDENQKLFENIGDLVAESFEYIKKNGLLTLDFIEMLPISADYLIGGYKIIYTKILDAFKSNQYILTTSGNYQLSENCYTGSSSLKSLLKEDDLTFFIGYLNICWTKHEPSIEFRAKQFFQDIGIEHFSDEKFLETLLDLRKKLFAVGEVNKEVIKFFEVKSDQWYIEFYLFLYDTCKKQEELFERNKYNFRFLNSSRRFDFLLYKSFLRLENNLLCIDNDEDVYFRTDVDFNSENFQFIKNETCQHDKSSVQNKILFFLRDIVGVKDIGEKEKIEYILKNVYSIENSIPIEEHHRHIKNILDYANLKNIAKDELTWLNEYRFVFCEDNSGKAYYLSPKDVYLDTPYQETGLKSLKAIKDIAVLHSSYQNLPEKELNEFINLLKNIGIHHRLEVKKQSTDMHIHSFEFKKPTPSNYHKKWLIDDDYFIEELEKILKAKDLMLSQLLWEVVISSKDEYKRAIYRPYKNSRAIEKDSTLLLSIKNYAWIPNQAGEFFRPSDILKDEIHSEFVLEDKHKWFQAMGLGENIRKSQEEYVNASKIVTETTGWSIELIEEAKKIGLTDEELKDAIDRKKAKSLLDSFNQDKGKGNTPRTQESKNFQSSQVVNDKEYSKKIEEKRENNKNYFKQKNTQYKAQDSAEIKRIKAFLYDQYHGHCQICGDTFLHKDKNYFKLHSLNVGEERDVNVEGNSLCLCPKHWTIFKLELRELTFWNRIKENEKFSLELFTTTFGNLLDWVSSEDINEDKDAFYNLPESDMFSLDEVILLPIMIFGKQQYLKMTKEHLLNLVNELNR